MTFQTFRNRVLVMLLLVMTAVRIQAQESQMSTLIGQSLAKIQQPTPEAFLQCVAELKRIDAMFPDSVQPKYQMALQSLYFCVMNPMAEQTENLLTETEQTLKKMQEMPHKDLSDRYYLDVMQHYEKALKLNPDNKLAKQLQQQFFEGMKQATGQ